MKLPKSMLEFDEQMLMRANDDGSIAAAHPLADVRDAVVTRRINWNQIGLGLMFWAFAYLSLVHIPWSALKWISVGFNGLIALTTLTSTLEPHLRLVLRRGTLRYKLEDDLDACRGFVLTLRERLVNRECGNAGTQP